MEHVVNKPIKKHTNTHITKQAQTTTVQR